jgi:hypothetical protein
MYPNSSIHLERIPTASMLIRIYKAPKRSDGTVMGLDNTPPEKWSESEVLIQAPVYQEGIYSKPFRSEITVLLIP